MLKTGEIQWPVSSAGGQAESRTWAIGVAARVLIGVLFGGFYAYQRRNSNGGNSPLTISPCEMRHRRAFTCNGTRYFRTASGNLNEQKQGRYDYATSCD